MTEGVASPAEAEAGSVDLAAAGADRLISRPAPWRLRGRCGSLGDDNADEVLVLAIGQSTVELAAWTRTLDRC